MERGGNERRPMNAALRNGPNHFRSTGRHLGGGPVEDVCRSQVESARTSLTRVRHTHSAQVDLDSAKRIVGQGRRRRMA